MAWRGWPGVLAVIAILAASACGRADEPARSADPASGTASEPTAATSPTRAGEDEQEIDDQTACSDFVNDVSVSYRVGSRSTDEGKVWWIEQNFDNRTGRVVEASTNGRGRATGLLQNESGSGTGGGPFNSDREIYWGASSADYLRIKPGRQQLLASVIWDPELVSNQAGTEIHTTSDGTVVLQSIEIDVWEDDAEVNCVLPVPESS